MIINPWGEIIAELNNDEPGIIVEELDFALVKSARAKIPSLANERAYRLEGASKEYLKPVRATA